MGRRIRKYDGIADANTFYYYGPGWQVLCEYDDAGSLERWYAYGNYIDEVLVMSTSATDSDTMFYIHDHLYSPAALTDSSGDVVERYEYDAYGNPYVLDADFSDDADGLSDYDNPYMFTGRRVDFLDNGNLTIQYNRFRYYDYYTGRWLSHDPIGYVDSLNLYEYVRSRPLSDVDPSGYHGPWWAPNPSIDLDPKHLPRPVTHYKHWYWQPVDTDSTQFYNCESDLPPSGSCKSGMYTSRAVYDELPPVMEPEEKEGFFGGKYKYITEYTYAMARREEYRCEACKWVYNRVSWGPKRLLCKVSTTKYKWTWTWRRKPKPHVWAGVGG